jgi:thiamine biosynthesis lipoprotein
MHSTISSKVFAIQPESNAPYSFEALGTTWWLVADADQVVLDECAELAKEFQARYSRFEDDSFIGRLNADKLVKNPHPELVAMMRYGMQSASSTDGLFNLTAGAQLARKGYGKEAADEFKENWLEDITVRDDLIQLGQDVSIDFGGFGKGWLVDSLHDHLLKSGASQIFVNGGGDIRLTQANSFEIPLMMPGDQSQYFAKVSIQTGSISSSSPLVRAWDEHNHLVDENGESYSGDITQLSIYAPLARDSDMAATACIISSQPFELAKKLNVEILATFSDGTYRASSNFPLI